MSGKILQVNISRGGVPKRSIFRGNLTRSGFDGDSFAHPKIHGGPSQAALLIANETIQHLIALGFPVYPGALGENLTTTGLDPQQWRAGQQFHVGAARIELTKPRAPCRTLDIYQSARTGNLIQKEIYSAAVKKGDTSAVYWGSSGFYARVLEEGEISSGDIIVLESQLA